MLKKGIWYLESKTDSRWNCDGECMCGGFVMPKEAKEKLELLKLKYGEPPADLKWGYEKY